MQLHLTMKIQCMKSDQGTFIQRVGTAMHLSYVFVNRLPRMPVHTRCEKGPSSLAQTCYSITMPLITKQSDRTQAARTEP